MATLPPHGDKYDFYSANGVIDFAYFPNAILSDIGVDGIDIPIRLQRGDAGFGAVHIVREHGRWLDLHKLDAVSMVWLKLQGNGKIYTTEEDDKLKINLYLHPKALLVLRFIPKKEPFFTVVTTYLSDGSLDGDELGHYPGHGNNVTPIFTLPEPKKKPTVIVKTKRTFIKPTE